MLNWLGARGADTQIEIWLDDLGSGSVELYEVGNPTPLAQGLNRLSYVLPARSAPISLQVVTVATRQAPGPIPLFMIAQQGGAVLEALEDATPANGTPPNGPARFARPVSNGTPDHSSTSMAFPV